MTLTQPLTQSDFISNGFRTVSGSVVKPRNDLLKSVSYKIDSCSEHFVTKHCDDCGVDFRRAVWTCGLPYCDKCSEVRSNRNYKRLASKKISSKRLFHFSIGFPLITPDGLTKELMDSHRKVMTKWLSRLTKLGYAVRAIRARDMSFHFDKGSLYVHYHYVALPDSRYGRIAKVFNDAISKVSEGLVTNVNVIGFRSKKNLLYYIARRQAGIFGHDGEDKDGEPTSTYGYSAFLSLEQYVKEVFDTRTLVYVGFPEGLACNIAPDEKPTCPFCGSTNLRIVRYEDKFGKEEPPPMDWSPDSPAFRGLEVSLLV